MPNKFTLGFIAQIRVWQVHDDLSLRISYLSVHLYSHMHVGICNHISVHTLDLPSLSVVYVVHHCFYTKAVSYDVSTISYYT